MKLDILPIYQEDSGLKNYLVTNFRRIVDGLGNTPHILSGVAIVTGSLIVTTGLTIVTQCSVSFASDPIPEACFVSVVPSAGNIIIKVFKLNWPTGAGSTFAASAVAKNINWIAIGSL